MLRLFMTLSCLLLLASVTEAQQPTTKPASEMSIAEIMKESHKKPKQLLKKVATGKANDQEKQRLVELYVALQNATPPKGDADSWAERTKTLVAAAKSAVAGKPDARQLLTKASNCMACHDAHKED